ncbi:MAG: zinc ribbon domain-containing protein [Candidatus Heimdallarchaeaceae archaeon]
MTAEEKKKGGSGLKVFGIFSGILIVGTLLASIVMMFISLPQIGTSMDLFWTSIWMMVGAGALFPVLLPIFMVMSFRRRRSMISTVQSMRLSKIGPYAPGFKPSGAKRASFCEYCGYEVRSGERECPECGGPVKTIKSSYYTDPSY